MKTSHAITLLIIVTSLVTLYRGTVCTSSEDWFSLGKNDAWAGCPHQAPDEDPLAASLYDLGYSEGLTQRSPNGVRGGS